MTFRGWPAEAIEFYEGLEADNSKAYWQDHKVVYEKQVREPMEELLPRSIDGRFLLVELEPDTPAAFLETAVARLAGEQLSPVFAHPERCPSVRECRLTWTTAPMPWSSAQKHRAPELIT